MKIYLYRVDDVHLSSYKVLDNLNRTDNKKESTNVECDDGNDEGGQQQAVRRRNADSRRGGNTETIESNLCKCEGLWKQSRCKASEEILLIG